MKYVILCFLSALLAAAPGFAAQTKGEQADSPNAAFGIAGSFSLTSAWERKKSESYMRYDLTKGYGGGLVFEKMFNNHLGINAGIWFNRLSLEMLMRQPIETTSIDPTSLIPMKLLVSGWTIGFPLSLVTSINASFFSLNFLIGIRYTHIVDSQISSNNIMISYKKHIDVLPLLSQPQFAFTAGIQFKFRVARFVDLFIGVGGGLSVTELIKGNNDIALLFDITSTAGIMFRTNIFPMPK